MAFVFEIMTHLLLNFICKNFLILIRLGNRNRGLPIEWGYPFYYDLARSFKFKPLSSHFYGHHKEMTSPAHQTHQENMEKT